MRTILFLALIITSFAATLQSCIEDKCVSVVCINEGVCVDGQCSCVYGYEGNTCEIVWTDKFIGGWQVKETGKAGVLLREYSVEAGRYIAVDSLYFIGINDVDDTVFAIREAYESFTLVPRRLINGDSVIAGSALKKEGNVVTGVYSLWKDSAQQNISFSLTR